MVKRETTLKLLVIDASTPTVFAAIMCDGKALALAESEAESLEGIFDCVAQVCRDSGIAINDCDGFAYCEGPGSILGLRLAAMAVSTWLAMPENKGKPVYTYKSLELVVASKLAQGQQIPFTVTADYRDGIVIEQRVQGNVSADTCPMQLPDPVLLEVDKLADYKGSVWRIPQRKQWKKAQPVGEVIAPYPFAEIPALAEQILRPVKKPKVWQISETEYAKWKGERHR